MILTEGRAHHLPVSRLEPPLTRLEPPLAVWALAARPSALQTMLSLASRPGIISFALGLPAPDLFPQEALARAAGAVLTADPRALQYSPPVPRLTEHVLALMAARGVRCRAEQIFITSGAQQGMSLLTRLLLDPHQRVIVERLTYTGYRQVLEPFSPEIVEVPSDPADGLDVDALARVLASGPRPALIYTIPQGHNPLGINLGAQKRTTLVQLAAHYGVPVIEDDAYGFLQYGEEMAAPLRALDEEWVWYVGSFSKIVAPALRQGWVVVPDEQIARLSIAKESSDINTATLGQRILCAYLDLGLLTAHVAMLRREYRTRRDTMLRELEAHLPSGTRWHVPDAGLFAWVELPSSAVATRVLQVALEQEQVAFLPGPAFSADGAGAVHCVRLNFSHSTVPVIEEGVRRLGRAVDRVVQGG